MIRERYYNKGMELEEYKTYVKQGRTIRAGSPEHLFMHSAAERARQYTAQMNAGSPSQERLQELFFTLTGQPKEESFHIFPPFFRPSAVFLSFNYSIIAKKGRQHNRPGTFHPGLLSAGYL